MGNFIYIIIDVQVKEKNECFLVDMIPYYLPCWEHFCIQHTVNWPHSTLSPLKESFK